MLTDSLSTLAQYPPSSPSLFIIQRSELDITGVDGKGGEGVKKQGGEANIVVPYHCFPIFTPALPSPYLSCLPVVCCSSRARLIFLSDSLYYSVI